MNADKPEQAEHESPPGPQPQSEPPASVYQPELSFIQEQMDEAEHLNSAEHSDHPHQTMSELRAQRESWAATRLQRFSLWVGLGSYAALRGMLWLILNMPKPPPGWEIPATNVLWIFAITFFLGLVWLSCFMAAMLGTIMPKTRRKMLLPLLMHLVFLAIVIPVIGRILDMLILGPEG